MNQTIAQPKSKPKGALIAALVFLLLGIAGCGFAAVKTVPYISDIVDFVSDLDQVASVRPMGEPVSFTSTGEDGIALLSGEAVCTGEGPSGAVNFERYEAFGPGTTVELGGVTMDGYILFDTESGADYTITCGAGGVAATWRPPLHRSSSTVRLVSSGNRRRVGRIVLRADRDHPAHRRAGAAQRLEEAQPGPSAGAVPDPAGRPPPPGQAAAPPAPGQNAWGSPQPPPAAPQPQAPPPQPQAPNLPPPAPGTPPPFTGGSQAPPPPGPGNNPPPPG
ncbi:MAG: DUF4179 domain-containing protein [Microthrixaceae bacterium]